MNSLKIAGLVALLPLLAVCVGCTASSKMMPLQPLEADLRTYADVIVSVESNVTEDVQEELSDLEGLVVSKIKALNAFQSVQLGSGSESSEGTLLVKVSISKIKKVSGVSRFMLGVFAGRASMTTDIVFVEAATGKTLGSYTVTGQSGGTGVSGGTSDAVKKTAEGIVDVISKNYTK